MHRNFSRGFHRNYPANEHPRRIVNLSKGSVLTPFAGFFVFSPVSKIYMIAELFCK
jgi:hypothetical protein